mmetsp:Transcript_8264/g.20890  ORF Transcript_8264/g.20890 Transcript_8264/m.20890 type:complete len:206 (-) Transcript_8264:302-919(-)
MFGLAYGFWEYAFRKVEFRVLILGVEQSGKTSALERLKALFSDAVALLKVVPTVGLNIARLEASGSNLVFWDLGGALGLRSIWENYYAEAHALVFVVDSSSDEVQMNAARDALQRALGSSKLSGAPLLVLANKSDLAGSSGEALSSIQQQFSRRALEIGDGSPDRAFLVLSACAHSGEGLREGIAWLVDAVKISERTVRLSRENL